MDERKAFIQGLRDLASFLESNEALPTPDAGLGALFCFRDREAFVTAARHLGFAAKEADEKYFSVVRRFGPVRYELFIDRGQVCEKTVIGTRTVPEHTEEIVEWKCKDSFLAPDEEQSA